MNPQYSNESLLWKMYVWSKTPFGKDNSMTYIVHYGDVFMGAIASQITSLMIVYSTVYSDADQRSVSLAFGRRIQRGSVIPRTNGQ